MASLAEAKSVGEYEARLYDQLVRDMDQFIKTYDQWLILRQKLEQDPLSPQVRQAYCAKSVTLEALFRAIRTELTPLYRKNTIRLDPIFTAFAIRLVTYMTSLPVQRWFPFQFDVAIMQCDYSASAKPGTKTGKRRAGGDSSAQAAAAAFGQSTRADTGRAGRKRTKGSDEEDDATEPLARVAANGGGRESKEQERVSDEMASQLAMQLSLGPAAAATQEGDEPQSKRQRPEKMAQSAVSQQQQRQPSPREEFLRRVQEQAFSMDEVPQLVQQDVPSPQQQQQQRFIEVPPTASQVPATSPWPRQVSMEDEQQTEPQQYERKVPEGLVAAAQSDAPTPMLTAVGAEQLRALREGLISRAASSANPAPAATSPLDGVRAGVASAANRAADAASQLALSRLPQIPGPSIVAQPLQSAMENAVRTATQQTVQNAAQAVLAQLPQLSDLGAQFRDRVAMQQ